MRKDPRARESRLPAIAIWTVIGALLGVAFSLAFASFPVPVVIGAVLGLAYGLFATRARFTPDDD